MRASVFAMCILATGCHAKFKKAAPYIEDINVQVITSGGPYVQLGKVQAPTNSEGQPDLIGEIAAAAINVTQAFREVNQTDRIQNAVNINDVNTYMTAGLADTLAGGPPFAYTEDSADATLQLNVVSYGVNVPYLGAPGEFTYSVQARMYGADGDRVYRKNLTCTVSLGDPSTASIVSSTVNNVQSLNAMTDAEINDAFRNVAAHCGQEFVLKMRKHAG